MGKIDKTVDPEFEAQCEVLKDIHRRYGLVVAAAKNFSHVLTQMAEAEKKLSESFYQLSMKEEQIKASFKKKTLEIEFQARSMARSWVWLGIFLNVFISKLIR